MPELRHLRAFAAVARARNFTRAAERLHMAQQAVSKSVRQLEHELGVTLLERTTREVRLTEAGRGLAEDAEAIIAAADAAFARASAAGEGLSGAITIGVTPPVGSWVVGLVVRRLRRAAPDLSVAVRDLRPAEVRPALAERRVDVVLARTVRDGQGLEVTELPPTPAVLVVPVNHPLAAEASVNLAALDGERLLTWSAPDTPYSALLVALCARAGATVTPAESAVTGAAAFSELTRLGAVAVVPAGPTTDAETTAVALRGDVALPLVAVRPAGRPSPAVARMIALARRP